MLPLNEDEADLKKLLVCCAHTYTSKLALPKKFYGSGIMSTLGFFFFFFLKKLKNYVQFQISILIKAS